MNFKDILIDRKKCIYYDITEYSKNTKSWFGGNAPSFFDDKERFFGGMYFYATLLNPFNETKQYSIFTPKDFKARIDKNIYPNCSSKLIEHTTTAISNKYIFSCPEIKLSSITLTKIADEKNKNATSFYGALSKEFEIVTAASTHDEEDKEPHFIKFGGHPFYIQGSSFYREELEKDGYTFLFSIDEDGYKNDCCEEYLFSYGAAYMFAQIENEKIDNTVFGCWQFS